MRSTVSQAPGILCCSVTHLSDAAQINLPLSETNHLRLRFQTLAIGIEDFHLCSLRDVQQCPDISDYIASLGISSATWPLFGVLWRAEELLSQLMMTEPVSDKRVLELGCGLALASLYLKRQGFDITATDLNPYANDFLSFNSVLNDIAPIKFEQAGWSDDQTSLGRFDLLIGSDLLYDHHNIKPLVCFLDSHLRPDGEILIVDPGRGLTRRFARDMKREGFDAEVRSIEHESDSGQTATYWVLRFKKH